MIDPIQPLAFPPAASVRADALPAASAADDQPGDSAGGGRDAPAAPPAKRDAVSLSVDRDDAGVFVYTLTDSASGRILAVIPRSAVVSTTQPGEGVDIEA